MGQKMSETKTYNRNHRSTSIMVRKISFVRLTVVPLLMFFACVPLAAIEDLFFSVKKFMNSLKNDISLQFL